MKFINDKTTIVIAGKWNRFLLSPQWVGTNLYEVDTINVEFASTMDAPPRYLKENKIFQVTPNHAFGIATNPTQDQNLIDVENIMDRLVTLLTYTPVFGLGINFSFELNVDESERIHAAFALTDSEKYTEEGLILNKTIVSRSFTSGDDNITINLADSEKTELKINFHFDLTTCKTISEYLDGTKFLEKRNKAQELINNLYQIELENEQED